MSEAFIPGLRYQSRAQELWALVVESFQGWEERITEVAGAAGLSPVSAWALVQLDPDHPVSQKELAARLKCNPSTVVDPTDRLEEADLVLRTANPADRRVNVLVVTATGKKVREELIERLLEPPASFHQLSGREHDRFRAVLLAAATGAEPAAPGPHRTRRSAQY
ncbi:MAG TPA: MarR family winged helix-turn-helix transcriptional regulator [Candidatus Dormibacteraeota bacterium]